MESEMTDCLGCRIMGTVSFLACSGYTLYHRPKLTPTISASSLRWRQALNVISLGFLGAAVYRWNMTIHKRPTAQ
ncbi:mitochondrial Complex I (CI) assembly protein DMAC1 [Andalucia godoyi]|uniref:Mitochondrial Complex I (CI) assembly protein DMAC1 n=1 Tax=Andalucia godoyi TaxID=505711 RepID=A0A8K0AJS9_ANDGO|nr:mitochondrial Complex I (CI) assembly protein DMAC1 [Andalucia godoyi]|eukprot:ANDGO_08811.mRNA.1 mitochondrial Complex I (CI) assembly protein DMAC1